MKTDYVFELSISEKVISKGKWRFISTLRFNILNFNKSSSRKHLTAYVSQNDLESMRLGAFQRTRLLR